MNGTTIFIVEDHEDMRFGLSEFLSLQDGFAVLGGAATAEEALRTLETTRPDLLLVDVALPGMTGLELVGRVADRWPEIRCVIVSGHAQAEHVDRALTAGARGYVVKGNPYELPRALREVAAGRRFLSCTLRERELGEPSLRT